MNLKEVVEKKIEKTTRSLKRNGLDYILDEAHINSFAHAIVSAHWEAVKLERIDEDKSFKAHQPRTEHEMALLKGQITGKNSALDQQEAKHKKFMGGGK